MATRFNSAAPEPDALAAALRTAVGRFVRTVRTASGTARTAQSEVLAQLERDGPLTVAVLAAARGVTHQSMRLVVARLASQELVACTPDPQDGRSQRVALTSQGVAAVQADQAARSAWLSGAIAASLSAEERVALAAAVDLLGRLSEVDGNPGK